MTEQNQSNQLLSYQDSLQTHATISSDDSPLCKKRFLSYTSHTITWRSSCAVSS